MGIEIESEGDGNFIKFQLLQKKYFDQESHLKFLRKALKQEQKLVVGGENGAQRRGSFVVVALRGHKGLSGPYLDRQTDKPNLSNVLDGQVCHTFLYRMLMFSFLPVILPLSLIYIYD